MCDKLRTGDMTQNHRCDDCVIPKSEMKELWCNDTCKKTTSPPQTAYELLMKKKRIEGVTMWFTETKCNLCDHEIYTDGILYWCSGSCRQNGMQTPDDKNYMGFISDLIR